jgi:two-component system phosphate regulon sensor histidine kinase PhoR
MRKSSFFLFVIFLFLILCSLVAINFFQDTMYLSFFGHTYILIISGFLVALIILSFTYREIENERVQNEFITIVTHKFRTPLTGIRWTIDMLQKDLTLLEKKDLLVEMQKANDRLMEIVDLLVGFAKFDKRLTYAFEAVSLRELIDFSLNKYAVAIRNKGIQISVESDRALPMIIVDKAKVQFVIDMLIDNATKYTSQKGSISVAFETDEKSVTIRVSDTGIGLGFWDKHRLFRHFFRATSAKLMDTNGLGLGLYTAKKIVDHHKGKIWAESEGLGKGSTFCVRLPIKR